MALGQQCGIGQVLSSLEPLDLTLYPVVAVLDVKLPVAPSGYPPETLVPVTTRSLDCSSLTHSSRDATIGGA